MIAATVLGTGAVLGVATSVSQSASAGADTPSFTTTCTNVPGNGTVLFPTIITGSIPSTIADGAPFTLSGYAWNVTIPASITAQINGFYGANAQVQATYGTTIQATGATPSSQAETLDFPTVTVPASGSFLMTGTPTSGPSFTGTGASVSITPGPTLTGFQIIVNGGSTGTFGCTTPTPAPVIAFAAGSNGPYAFVTGPGPNLIAPIDLATGTEGTPFNFNVGEPGGIAITPNGQTAYVAGPSTGGDSITPVNTTTDAVGTPIVVGDGVSSLAITPDGSTAYAVSSDNDTVVPVDLATQSAETPIGVGSDPVAVAITPDGSTALVVNTDDGTVTPIDIATQTAETPIDVGSIPDAIAITPDGSTALVTNSGDGTVTPIDIATQTAETPITVGDNPEAIAITPDGSTAFAVNEGSDSVTPIDIASLTAGTPIGVGSAPNAISVSPDGLRPSWSTRAATR